ncbi:MAG TPA: DUF5668 domain-containing protein [Anaerolineales bacterium]|nr:DUF5668 domain-containing protein [Anaerolineales bacterium]
MNRDNIFWGAALILLGVLFLLQNQGVIPSILPFLWPLALILFGSWLILSVYWKPKRSEVENFIIPLEGAKSVNYKFMHGAGEIEIRGGAPMGTALVGTSAAGLNQSSRLNGERLEVRIEAGGSFVPFVGPSNGIWRFQLTPQVPVTLHVETGASHLNMDLREVQAAHITLKTSASKTDVILPARGASLLDLEAGTASINIRVPEGTAARIRFKEGLNSLNVDTNRFPPLDAEIYQSPDFDSAVNRAEINIQAGMASISIS